MNAEKLRRIADEIEKHPEQFDMGDYFSNCGTVMCIAGWAIFLYKPSKIKMGNHRLYGDIAGEILELTESELGDLFFTFSTYYEGEVQDVNGTNAPRCLRWMADNEKIDWAQAMNRSIDHD